MDKVDLFTNWFYEFESPPELIDLSLEALSRALWTNNKTNFILEDRKCLLKGNLKPLRKWFKSCLEEVRKDLQLSCERLDITDIWGNRTSMGQSHHRHYHDNSWASAVYYVTPSNAGTKFFQSSYWSATVLQLMGDSAIVTYEHKATPGKLIIFPSFLIHEVGVHDMPDPRYSISFNTFPGGKIWHPSADQDWDSKAQLNLTVEKLD